MKKFLSALLLLPSSLLAYDNISLTQTVPFEKNVKEPASVLACRSGKVVVSDAGMDGLAVFSSGGKFEGRWGQKGKGPGQFDGVAGLAEDAQGRVYAADPGNNRVHAFSADGKHLFSIGAKGAGPGQFSEPRAVAATHDGYLLVLDAGNSRIQIFSLDGIYFQSFGAPGSEKGQFKDPSAMAVSPAGKVYVLDRGNKRVQIFSTQGKFIGVLGGPGTTGKENESLPEPAALAVGPDHHVYVADGQQNRVKEFSPKGEFMGVFGTWGAGPGQFKKIAGLALTSGNDVITADASNRRLQIFKLENASPASPLTASPTLRLLVKPLPPVSLEADDLVFFKGKPAAVARKKKQVLLDGKDFKTSAQEPAAVAASGGVLLVTDAGGKRVLLLDEQGQAVGPGQIGGAGKRDGQFKAPAGAAVDAQGRIYVADSSLARVQAFSRDGIFLYSMGMEGKEAGQFTKPSDVAALPDAVAVLDAERRAVLSFDLKGKFLTEASGSLAQPVALAAGPSTAGGFYSVLDAGAGRVQIYQGKQLIAAFGSTDLFRAPKALAYDDQGRLHVADGTAVKPFELYLLPREPVKFEAAAGEGQITLRWAPDAEKLASAYVVYRSTGGDDVPSAYEAVSSTVTSFIDRDIVPGLTYYYFLAPALEAGGERREGSRALAKAWTLRPANLPSLEISSIALENIFSAQYKYYADHPVGRVALKNNTEKTFQQVRVGFIIQDFMDYPTEALIERLDPGERRELDLRGVFNNKILSVSEDTPLQAQLSVTYYQDSEEKTFKRTQPFTLYSRNAMSWEDPLRIANFVTPKDPPVLQFARQAVQGFQGETAKTPVDRNIVLAQAVYHALGARGLSYLKDPNNPYEKAVQNAKAIDYVQYPRDTLNRKSGDCDDLANLYAAALESVTVPSALADVPGHVMVLVQAEAAGFAALGFPQDMTVEHGDALWIPVEVTMVGKSFLESWREGARLYRQAAAQGKARVIDLREGWRTYAPATLPEGEAIAAPSREDVLKKFPDETAKLEDFRLTSLARQYQEALQKDPKNADAHLQLGILYAQHGKLKESGEWFSKLLQAEPAHSGALNNQANVSYMLGEFEKAKGLYEKAAAADPKDAWIALNLARAAWELGDKAGAEKAFKQALFVDPDLKNDFRSLDDLVK